MVGDGVDALHLGPLGLPQLPDPDIIQLAFREGRTIVTLDRDFSRLIALSGSRAPSVIYIRENVDRETATVLVRAALQQCQADLAAGSMISITREGMRIRRLPVLPEEA